MDTAEAMSELPEEMVIISSESDMLMTGGVELPWTDSMVDAGVGGGGAAGAAVPGAEVEPEVGTESESLGVRSRRASTKLFMTCTGLHSHSNVTT